MLTFWATLIPTLIGAILFSAVCALTLFYGIKFAIFLMNKIGFEKLKESASVNSHDNEPPSLNKNEQRKIPNQSLENGHEINK